MAPMPCIRFSSSLRARKRLCSLPFNALLTSHYYLIWKFWFGLKKFMPFLPFEVYFVRRKTKIQWQYCRDDYWHIWQPTDHRIGIKCDTHVKPLNCFILMMMMIEVMLVGRWHAIDVHVSRAILRSNLMPWSFCDKEAITFYCPLKQVPGVKYRWWANVTIIFFLFFWLKCSGKLKWSSCVLIDF